jgi:ribonuclease Z
MAARELVVLGTASQTPTRTRNHNGYLLRWDDQGLLFDPGEGTQRQMLLAGVPSSAVTRICLTHLHGDHALGLPGVLQRMSLDRVPHPVPLHYPASGAEYVARLRHATPFLDLADVREEPVPESITAPGVIATGSFGRVEAHVLDHRIDCVGYRLVEPDGRRMVPELLEGRGVRGPAVRRLQEAGELDVDGGIVRLDEVSVPRPGQRFAFVMDTRLCPGVYSLAEGVDMLLIESTFLDADAGLATAYGHLTAGQAGAVAAACGVRMLVLTHFSQRYTQPERFGEEAAARFGGDIVVAADLARVPMPTRRLLP